MRANRVEGKEVEGKQSRADRRTCRNSSAMVPCPAMTCGWLYGGMSAPPVDTTVAAAVLSRAASVGSQMMTFAP